MMDEYERYRRMLSRRRAAHRRLGTVEVACMCGETDPDCFEDDHPFRRAFDGTTFQVCKNCHAKKSARERSEDPPIGQGEPNPFERMAHALLGMARYNELSHEHLIRIAGLLFAEAAKDRKRKA
jgi:hypothetical protein